MNILISILGGVVAGLIIGYFLWPRLNTKDLTGQAGDDFIRAKEEEKAANIERLKNFIATKDRITNEEVQNLLKVSDATAVRYLDELETEGLIRQVGDTGQSVYYAIT